MSTPDPRYDIDLSEKFGHLQLIDIPAEAATPSRGSTKR